MKKIFSLFFVVLFTGVFLMPVIVDASGCECWCKSNKGAISSGDNDNSNDCYDACKQIDKKFLGCFDDDDSPSLPKNNQLCWTEEDCETTMATDFRGEPRMDGNNTLTNDWGGQADICIEDEGFCFSPPEKIKLGVAIGGMTEVSELQTYINAFYAWILPAASLLAIVLIMVGGLQWSVARGNASAVQKAKDRIVKAVFGLVLLFGAYAIANLIDPRLTTLNSLRLPLIQKVIFLDDQSCENLAKSGVTISPDPETSSDLGCGDVGIIESLDDVSDNAVASGLEVGDECKFKRCPTDMHECSYSTATREWECLFCHDIYPDNPNQIQPSISTCSQYSEGLLFGPKGEEYYQSCFFTRDSSVVPDDTTDFFDFFTDGFSDSGGGTCASLWIECDELNACTGYNDAFVASSGKKYDYNWLYTGWNAFIFVHNMFTDDTTDLQSITDVPKLKEICEKDPCKVGGCAYFSEQGACHSSGWDASEVTSGITSEIQSLPK